MKFNRITFRFRPGSQTISQNKAKGKTFLVKMSFICNCIRMNWKSLDSHLASL